MLTTSISCANQRVENRVTLNHMAQWVCCPAGTSASTAKASAEQPTPGVNFQRLFSKRPQAAHIISHKADAAQQSRRIHVHIRKLDEHALTSPPCRHDRPVREYSTHAANVASTKSSRMPGCSFARQWRDNGLRRLPVRYYARYGPQIRKYKQLLMTFSHRQIISFATQNSRTYAV